MKPESIVEKLISAVERGDLDKMASLYAPNAIQHHPLAKGQLTGRQAIREAKLPLVGAFPNATFKTRTLLANESTVVAEGVLSATNTGVLEFEPGQQLPPTGRPIEIPSVWVIELDANGLIAVERDYFDTAILFRQLKLQD
jgi:predicted ester cyclase